METRFIAKNSVTGLYFTDHAPGHILCGFYEPDPAKATTLLPHEANNVKLTFSNVILEESPRVEQILDRTPLSMV